MILRRRKAALVFLLWAFAAVGGCTEQPSPAVPPAVDTVPGARSDDVISDAVAIEAARAAIAGELEIPADVKPVVSRDGTQIVVEFPANVPPDTLGPDYHARVTLDGKTGEVVGVLSGS